VMLTRPDAVAGAHLSVLLLRNPYTRLSELLTSFGTLLVGGTFHQLTARQARLAPSGHN
jgi:hypothetical protein